MSIRDRLKSKIPLLVPAFDFVKVLCSICVIPLLIKMSRKKNFFAVVPNGIGETVIVMSYIESYMKMKKLSTICLVTDQKRKGLGEILRKENVQFVFLKSKTYSLLVSLMLSPLGKKITNQLGNVVMFDSQKRQNRIGDNAFLDMREIMQINKSDCYTNPLSISYCDAPSKYNDCVLLNPYARTIKNKDNSFFENVVRQLKSLGIQTYTVVQDENQKAIEGTERIVCSLEEAVSIALKSRCIIGLRSGFIDLMSLTGKPIICVYPESNENDMYFSFSGCEWSKKILEVTTLDNIDIKCVLEYIRND